MIDLLIAAVTFPAVLGAACLIGIPLAGVISCVRWRRR